MTPKTTTTETDIVDDDNDGAETTMPALSSRTSRFDLKVRPAIERKNPGDSTSTKVHKPTPPLPLAAPAELSARLVARQLTGSTIFPHGHE